MDEEVYPLSCEGEDSCIWNMMYFFPDGPHFADEFNLNSNLLLLEIVHILSKLPAFLLKLDFTPCSFFFYFFIFIFMFN